MSAPRKWQGDVHHLGGRNYLVLLWPGPADDPNGDPWAVVVSRIHGREYAAPRREDGRYPVVAVPTDRGLRVRRFHAPPRASRAVFHAARRIAAPYLGDAPCRPDESNRAVRP